MNEPLLPSRFGDAAVRLGYLDADQVRETLLEQARRRRYSPLASPIGSLLRERGLLTPSQITAVLRHLSGGDLPPSDDGIHLAVQLRVLHAQAGNIIGITGSTRQDSARTTVELAVALAVMEQGAVLAVDADVRHPSLQALMQTPLIPGLTEHIAAGGAHAPLPLPCRVEALGVVPAGAPAADVVAMCMSREAAAVIEGFRQQHRYVLVNLGPIMTQPEAAVTASRCDGVLTVLQAGRSRKSELREMQRMLQGLGVRHSGVVLARLLARPPSREGRR